MKLLIGCEESGRVREAFRERGHDAVSCDLVPSRIPGPHIIGDVRELLTLGWDAAIFFPPCTRLAVSGARWFSLYRREQEEALALVRDLLAAPIEKIALENPVSIIATRIAPPTQYIQPWQFGHGETKKTCLWLKGFPPLVPTNEVAGREARVHRLPPSPERARIRSLTYQGIANAMAAQWG